MSWQDERSYFGDGLRTGDPATWQAVLEAVAAEHGNVSRAARLLGVNPRSAQRWRNAFPRLARAIRKARAARRGMAVRLDETAPTDALQPEHDGSG